MLSPEVIAEQVMGYAVGAMEIIPTLKSAAQKSYDIAIIPQGPHFYTGLLQAAGYLLLNKQKKKLLIISQQSDDPKHILIDTTAYEPVFGKTRAANAHDISSIKKTVAIQDSTKKHKEFSQNLSIQMPFFRVLTQTEELIHIGIGEKTPQIHIKKCISWIIKNSEQYAIVLLTNIEFPGGSKKTKKNNEQQQIVEYIQAVNSSALVQIFQAIVTKKKLKTEMIAYAKPQKVEKKGEIVVRYVCAVG